MPHGPANRQRVESTGLRAALSRQPAELVEKALNAHRVT
jgi:hypothetical protein